MAGSRSSGDLRCTRIACAWVLALLACDRPEAADSTANPPVQAAGRTERTAPRAPAAIASTAREVKASDSEPTGEAQYDLLAAWEQGERLVGDVLVHRFGVDADSGLLGDPSRHGWGPPDRFEKLPGRLSSGPVSTLKLPARGQAVALRIRTKGATALAVHGARGGTRRFELEPDAPTTIGLDLAADGPRVLQLVPNVLSHYPDSSDLRPGFLLQALALGTSVKAAIEVLATNDARKPEASAGALSPREGRSWVIASPPAAQLLVAARATCDAQLRVVREVDGAVEQAHTLTLEDGRGEATFPLEAEAGQAVRLRIDHGGADCPVAIDALKLRWQAPRPKPIAATRSTIVVLVDTLRADRTAAAPREARPPTPAHDRVAGEGIAFSRAASTSNWTLPAVASLMTGTWPQTHGVTAPSRRLPAELPLLPERLQRRGVATAAFAVNGYVSAKYGFERGWDAFRNYTVERAQGQPIASGEEVFRDALTWLDAHASQPFFLYLHTFEPHAPYAPSKPFGGLPASVKNARIGSSLEAVELERMRRKTLVLDAPDRARVTALYDGEVVDHDRQFAAFVQELERRGLLDDVLLVFMSDHGEELHDHGSWGHQHSTYEELLHVPLMLRAGATGKLARRDDPVSIVDVYATVAANHGLDPESGSAGRDLRTPPPPELQVAPRALLAVSADGHEIAYAGRYKQVRTPSLGAGLEQLVDLGSDPLERAPDNGGQLQIASELMWRALARGAPARGPAERMAQPVKAEVDSSLSSKLRALGYAQ